MAKNYLIISAILILFSANKSISASQPPGLEKQTKSPPGFSQGKKKGWKGSNPPGWNKSGVNQINNQQGKKYVIDDLESYCSDLADGEFDERCKNMNKKGKKVIKSGHIKGNIKKEINKD